jgi:hypothetical protein
MRTTLAVTLAAIALLGPPSGAAAQVGFRIVEIPDSSRAYSATGRAVPRPLHVMLWYPAARSSAPRMTLRNFVRTPGVSDDRGSATAVRAYRATYGRNANAALDAWRRAALDLSVV